MPRVHRITPAPGAGDCFFHVVAYFIGRPIRSVTAAGEARAAIAGRLARDLFQAPYNNIVKLSELVLHADSDAALDVVQLKATDDVEHLVALRPGAGLGARNGELVPLAAWVVWLQFDAEQIAALTHMRDRAPVGLHNGQFLAYTLWGDAALCAEIVRRLSGRPVAIYQDTNEQMGLVNPINVYYANNHFDAIEFVDVSEVEVENLFTNLALEGVSQSCAQLPTCDQVYATVQLSNLGQSTSSGKAQYADPGIVVPDTYEERLALCRCLLRERRRVMSCQYAVRLYKNGQPIEGGFLGKLSPVYVITSNRSGWLKSFPKNSVLKQFIGGDRPVIFTAGEGEVDAYLELSATESFYVLDCSGGFGIGWNRYCAVRHARENGASTVWLLDDNVKTLTPDLDDGLLSSSTEELFPYFTFFPTIMQQAVGLDLKLLATLPGSLARINFCPYFVYSKEDLSLALVLSWLIEKNFNASWRYPYGNQSVQKVDKTTIPSDVSGTRSDRADRMAEIARFPVWRYWKSKDEGGGTAPENHDLSDAPINSYLVMKYQEQLLYNCLSEGPLGLEVLITLVQEGWFSDDVA